MKNVIEINSTHAVMGTVQAIKALIDAKTVTGAQIAKEVGVSTSTISQILNESYKGDVKHVSKKLAQWLTLREQKNSAPISAPTFVATHTATRIYTALEYAHATECITVIYGASGVGKSTTIKQYKKENLSVWMITASPSVASLSECLYELALELGMDDAPRRKGPLSRAIKHRLEGTGGLLVIDEADHLSYETLEELRILQEQTEIGMVLVGNNRIYTQLTGGRRNEDFARLFSRIAKKVGVHVVRNHDVDAIATAWGVTGREEKAMMAQISKKPGALRLLNQTLKMALLMSGGTQSQINLAHIQAAFKDLESE